MRHVWWRMAPVLGLILGIGALFGASLRTSAEEVTLERRAILPGVARAALEPTPTPTPPPSPYIGDVASIYLASAGIYGDDPMQRGATHYDYAQGREVLDDPTAPQYIMWYPELQGYGPPSPGFAGTNSVMAAHVNYFGYGNGPFASLLDAGYGDTLYVTMDNGDSYAYTVTAVDLYSIYDIDMEDVVYPALDAHTERVTLISCGGTFVPRPGGGGDYLHRVVLRAERYVP